MNRRLAEPAAARPADVLHHLRTTGSPMPSDRSVEITRAGYVTVIGLGPGYETVDESAVEELSDPILDAARSASPPWIVLDLSHTKFFGSSFIEVLFRAYNRLREKGDGRFAICGLTPYCREVVEITHLDRLWKVHSKRAEAVAAVQNAE
ncbi:MAG: STAS domain-containing protein [Planctomycetales bacterium]